MPASMGSTSPGRRSRAWSSTTVRCCCARGTAPIPPPIVDYCVRQDLALDTFASVEAQLAALADDIAYNNHDVDDGYRAGLFTFAELAEVPLAGRALAEVRAAYPGLDGTRALYETTRRLITALIDDAVAETRRRLERLSPISADDVRHAGHPVVAFSASMTKDLDALRAFLAARVYRHPRVERVMQGAERIVTDLFARYRDDLQALPPEWREQAPAQHYVRYVCDFIAGMTDRYALAEHRRLFDATPELR